MSTSEPDLLALVELIPEAVAIVAPDGTIAAVNRAFGRMSGWPPAAVAGRSLLEFIDGANRDLLEYLRRGASTRDPVPGAFTIVSASGQGIACRADGWVVRPRSGDHPAAVAVRLVRRSEAGNAFLELTRRIGDLTAEIARRRQAESQLASALEGLTETQQRLALLTEASATLLASVTVSDVLGAIGMLMGRLLPADAHAVWKHDVAASAWRIAWQHGLSGSFVSEISRWSGSRATAVPFDIPLAVTDVFEVPLLEERRQVYESEGIRSLLVIPLRLHAANFGTVVAYFRNAVSFTEADLRVATAIGNMGSSALMSAELHEAQAQSRAIAESNEARARFLAAAGATLASSLGYEDTLRRVAELAVPAIADWCAVDILDADGVLRRVAATHTDPDKVELARMLHERYPPDPDAPRGVPHVIRTGAPEVMSRIPEELIRASARDAQHLEMLLALGLVSYMCVPMLVQGRAIGALSFVSAESGREYSADDLRFAQDVAFRAALAVENARAYEEARRANQLKDDFLATLSHELRTPLNAILGYTRMLRTGALGAERQPAALETIERNAMSLHQIVEDVLDVSRIVAGKVRLHVQPVALPAVMADALATIRPAADAKGVRLESILDPLAPAVAGDPDRLQQILWNLLSNAVKFTPRGGRVQLRLEAVSSHVEIVVSDTGGGISPDFLPHIFERFRQGDSGLTREHGGLGLGLAITRHLVELHGGSIAAASDGPGTGTTFRVKLPALIVHQEAFAEASRAHPRRNAAEAPAETGSLSGVDVLAIDDEPDALALVCEVLESAGARVRTACSAAAALDSVARERPHVILSDVGMPGMDGWEFVTRLRQSADAATRAVPAAALTALARSEDRIRTLTSGFQMHIAKPVNPAELIAAVRALASRAELSEPS